MLAEHKLDRLKAWLDAVTDRPSCTSTMPTKEEMVELVEEDDGRIKAMACSSQRSRGARRAYLHRNVHRGVGRAAAAEGGCVWSDNGFSHSGHSQHQVHAIACTLPSSVSGGSGMSLRVARSADWPGRSRRTRLLLQVRWRPSPRRSAAAQLDTFEAEDGPPERRVLEEGGADLLEHPEDFEDEEIDSDDEDVDEVLVGRRRKARRRRVRGRAVDRLSSVDPEELTIGDARRRRRALRRRRQRR